MKTISKTNENKEQMDFISLQFTREQFVIHHKVHVHFIRNWKQRPLLVYVNTFTVNDY